MSCCIHTLHMIACISMIPIRSGSHFSHGAPWIPVGRHCSYSIYIYTFIKQWFRNHTWYIILHTHQKCSLLTILRRMTMSPQIHRPCGWLLRFGEGYFEGLWYCSDCWDSWQDAPAEMTTISPWPLEAGVSTKGWCGWPVRPWVN